MFTRIQWRIVAAYVVLIVAVTFALGIYLVNVARDQPAPSPENLALAVGAAMGVAVILAIFMVILITRTTIEPIDRLIRIAQRMADGDLDQSILIDSSDKVGQLASEFQNIALDLRQKLEAIEEQRAEVAAILGGMADGALVVDDDRRVIAMNRAAEQMLEVDEATARGRTVAEVVRHHALVARLVGVPPTDTPLVVEVGRDRRQVQVVVTPVRVGKATRQVVLLQDVTALRQAEAIRRDFVANVSHELRTPLASLRALVETLEDGALEDPPAAREFLGRMHVEVDGLSHMVEELLELARIESGRVQLHFTKMDVGPVVADAAERLRPQAERQGVTLKIVVSEKPVEAAIDAQRLQQVVINLVHNGIKFTPPGGSVSVAVELRSPYVAIVIADTGIGVARDYLPRLFERFYKADRSRATSGTGLGLAIVKHLVQAHGGHVWATSPGEGQGTTFTVLVPARGPSSALIETLTSRLSSV